MNVTVKFIGAFRSSAGKDKLTIILRSTARLEDAISRVIKTMPKLKRTLIDVELENPKPNALILVNGKEISVLNGLETILKDGDEVVLIPVIHGG